MGTEEVSVEECCFKKGKRVLTDKDQEAVKECYKEYIGMVKIYYEEAKRSRHGEPGDVAVNCRGTAGKERPQADARIDAEVEEMLDGTPRKKSRTARDDVKMEGNKNKRRNSRNFCGGTTQREETRLLCERILLPAHMVTSERVKSATHCYLSAATDLGFVYSDAYLSQDPLEQRKAMMTTEYCPATEIQRMEQELWTLTLKGDGIEAYNNRFHELVLMCPEARAKGRGYAGNLPWCNRCKAHHQQGLCPPRCGKCHKLGLQEEECRTRIPVAGGNSLQNVTCFGCGNHGHYRSDARS
ncbi:hypothetical protein Tco_0581795 [Tanacetum coccineum]